MLKPVKTFAVADGWRGDCFRCPGGDAAGDWGVEGSGYAPRRGEGLQPHVDSLGFPGICRNLVGL